MSAPTNAPRPWLSVLLPTRNRQLMADVAARSVLAALGDDVELVIGDNSDAPGVWPDDPRVRVLGPAGVLSMPANWERLVRAARGEWLLLMGDRMRLVPDTGALLRDLTARGFPVVSHLRARFYQSIDPDDLTPHTLVDAPGETALPPSLQPPVDRASFGIVRTLFGVLEYQERLPMLYNSTIHRSVIERAASRSDRVFRGVAPDVDSSLLVGVCSDRYLATDLPLVVEQYPTRDVGRWSNGVRQTQKAPDGKGFWSEMGGDQASKPSTMAYCFFRSLQVFHEVWGPDLGPDFQPPWAMFAAWSVHEIARIEDPTRRAHEALRTARLLARSPARLAVLPRLIKALGSLALPAVASRLRAPAPQAAPAPPLDRQPHASLTTALEAMNQRCHELLA